MVFRICPKYWNRQAWPVVRMIVDLLVRRMHDPYGGCAGKTPHAQLESMKVCSRFHATDVLRKLARLQFFSANGAVGQISGPTGRRTRPILLLF